jgi:hypothetical protein
VRSLRRSAFRGRGQLARDERPRCRPQGAPAALVVRADNHLDREVEELKPKVAAPPFYRGIPSSEVIRALDELGYGGIATMDVPA